MRAVRWASWVAVVVVIMMVASGIAIFGAAPGSSAAAPSVAPVSGSPVTPISTATAAPIVAQQPVNKYLASSGVWNGPLSIDTGRQSAVQNVIASAEAAGLPASDILPPNLYSPPAAPSQTGGHIVPTFPYPNAPAPLGLGFYGLQNISGQLRGTVFNTTKTEGYFNTGDAWGVQGLYFDFGTQQTFGSQLNDVLCNTTLFGTGGYQMWNQNVINYNPLTGSLSFLNNVWNFSNTAVSLVSNSILTGHGRVSGGVYETSGGSVSIAYPFSFALYENSTVNTTYSSGSGSCLIYGCNQVFYNYSVWYGNGTHKVSGSYDWVVFNSQAATHHVQLHIGSANFQANGLVYNQYVQLPDDYEWDYSIGSSSGAQMNDQYADATLGLLYWNATNQRMQTVPSAYNYGSETGETGSGAAIGWTTSSSGAPVGVMRTGPSLLQSLWNISGTPSGVYPVNYAAVAPGNAFVAFATGAGVTNQSMFKVAPTFGWFTPRGQLGPNVYLTPGTYTVEILLSGYDMQAQTITLGPSGVTLTTRLSRDLSTGVYTPLWAFSQSDLANISTGGAGTLNNPYRMMTNSPHSMSLVFSDISSYIFPVWMGIYFNSTTSYVNFNPAPTLTMIYPSWAYTSKVQTYFAPAAASVPLLNQFQMYFYHAQNVSVQNAASIGGWFSTEEIGRKYNVYVNDGKNFLFAGDNFNVSSEGLDFLSGGTNNTVWGSTFSPWNGVAAYPGIVSPSVGLTIGESGDTVYNNAFYTNGTAAASSSFTDTWNVAVQPASNARFVNGFALSGSILGLTWQGGNYWFNYGAGPDPYGVIPYVARASSATGSAAIGKAGTGDFAPLTPYSPNGPPPTVTVGLYHVTFQETGAATGSWRQEVLGVPVYYALNGSIYHSNVFNTSTVAGSGSLNQFWLPNGTYTWVLSTPPTGRIGAPGYLTGTVVVNGANPATISISFISVFAVTFTETGLVAPIHWYLNVTGYASVSSTSTTAVISLPNGTSPTGFYTYSLASANKGYKVSPATGSFNVTGATVAKSAPFTAVLYQVTFTESGLPSATKWYLNVTGQTSVSSTTTKAFTNLTNGTYTYVVASSNKQYAVNPATGNFTIAAAAVTRTVTFSQFTLTVTFTESGLPSGTRWYFNVTGQTSVSSTTTTASINLVNGTYSYLVAPSIKTYATYPVHGTFTVAGSAIALSGTFSAVSFIIAFTETGLPVHTKWFVNVTGQSSVSSTTTTLNVSVVNGTYTYGIAAANGYTPSPLSGILSISGAGTAIPVTFSVTVLTFHAVGSLPSSWTVRLNSSFTNVSKTATGSAYVNFTTPAGVTYFYAIVVASPYTATPQNGIVVLVASATVNITMHRGSAPATFSLTFNEAGLAAGVVWSVTVNGTGLNTVQTSSASSQTFVGLVSGGSYAYAVSAATYTATPSSGTVLANANQTVSITFVTVYYPVTFNPHGLGVNSWTVTLNGVAKTASGQIVFSEPLGFYTYTVSAPSGYSASPSSGTVHVTSSAGVTTTVTLAALTPYVLSFSESGLTAGASWTVVVNGVSLTGTSSTQGMSVANGTYSYVVSATSGQLPSPSSGSVAVLGASASIAITFPSIMLRFNATGLASGTSWTVTVNGQAQTGTGNLTWYVSPGSYTYVITAPSGYAATMWSGTVSVVSSSVTVSVAFTPAATYVLAFHETGLSPSTPWSVTVNGVVWPGTGSTISASVPAGTYSYRVGSIAGFRATPSSGAVAVGSSVTIGISFLPIGASLPLTYPTVVLAAVRTR